jgi:hypothetical protein
MCEMQTLFYCGTAWIYSISLVLFLLICYRLIGPYIHSLFLQAMKPCCALSGRVIIPASRNQQDRIMDEYLKGSSGAAEPIIGFGRLHPIFED